MYSVILDEPELEFGGAARHIDPRFGITNYGPADLGAADAPRAIRIGLVGPADQLEGLRRWLERCREPIAPKDEQYPHLFPEFPGCDTDRGCTPPWSSVTGTHARSAAGTCAPSRPPTARQP